MFAEASETKAMSDTPGRSEQRETGWGSKGDIADLPASDSSA
jgi:hypothetical protein